jgi:hypothetical protein
MSEFAHTMATEVKYMPPKQSSIALPLQQKWMRNRTNPHRRREAY